MIETQLESFLLEGRKLIEKALDDLIKQHPELPYAHLFSAARYTLLSPAKRLRPLLVLAVAASYDVPLEHALQPACAIEMIHTYSLIHDDLPCMDDDDFRRGQLTLHKIYPEGHAVLTGDYLLTYAFEVIATVPILSDTQKIALVHSLAKHAGAQGMIGGQVIDLDSENKAIDWTTLELMHSYKTASLIIASLDFGAIIAHAPSSDQALLHRAGRAIGLAFQIVDDILDHTSTFAQMGKKSGSDANKKKATSLSLMSLEQSHLAAQELLSSSLKDLAALSQPTPLLTALFDRLVNRHH
jgi:geranylgeranyl diphosphate synthase type II